jgi:hypothetical protein
VPAKIEEHEGKKYLRTIWAVGDQVVCDPKLNRMGVQVDVYAVLIAFNVTCPARQHALKKLLCSGIRGKGSELDDLNGALAAVSRAIEIQRLREREDSSATATEGPGDADRVQPEAS